MQKLLTSTSAWTRRGGSDTGTLLHTGPINCSSDWFYRLAEGACGKASVLDIPHKC